MSWIRLDDCFGDHPKFLDIRRSLLDAATSLWVRAIGHCNKHNTDGFIVRGAIYHLSASENPEAVAAELVRVGLWAEGERGWLVHDYHDYQPRADKAKASKTGTAQARSEAGRRGAAARWQTDGKPMANASDADGKPMAPYPYPLLTTTAPAGERREQSDHPEQVGMAAPERPADAPDVLPVAPDHESPVLPPPRASNGQPDAVAAPPVAPPAGTDLLTMAHELAQAGNAFGRKMVDHAAQARSFSAGQKETIRKVYAEHFEGLTNAVRAATLRNDAGPPTPRSGHAPPFRAPVAPLTYEAQEAQRRRMGIREPPPPPTRSAGGQQTGGGRG